MEQLITLLENRNTIDIVRKTYGTTDELLYGETSDLKKLIEFKLSLLLSFTFTDMIKVHKDRYDKDKTL